MHDRYKIILSNNCLYKEIELDTEVQQLKVGTGVDCDVRLRKDLFFGPVELTFLRAGDGWTVYCSDSLYFTTGDIPKYATWNLTHGDTLELRNQDTDHFLFSMEFLVDFNDGKRKYERCIYLSGGAEVSIGASPYSNILLGGEYVKADQVRLVRRGKDYQVEIWDTAYGVYINGRKAASGDLLRSGDFLSVSDFFFYYKEENLWTEIRSDMKIQGLSSSDNPTPGSYPKFNRNSRIKPVVCTDKIQVLDPPTAPQKPKQNLFQSLLPSLGMFMSAGAMVIVSNSPTSLIMSGMTGIISIITAVMAYRNSRKEYSEGVQERQQKYTAYVANKRQEIQRCRAQERAELDELYISQGEAKRRLTGFSEHLFDRRREDGDYLCVRLGSGDVRSRREINYKKQEALEAGDELQQIPEKLCEEFKNVQDAPVVCDLKTVNAIGIMGAPRYRFEMMKNLVVDLAARQYFTDVKMIFVAEKQNKDSVYWLRFLPHVYNDTIDGRNIVCDDESKNLIFEYLYKELSFREQQEGYDENIIVFFYDECGFKSHPLSKFVDKAKDMGVTFLFFGDTQADIPQGCGYVVALEDGSRATLLNSQNKAEAQRFTYPTIRDEHAANIVQLLAPVHTEEISLEGTLTKNISMFELLNILAVDDLDLQARWASTQVFKSMAAPLGVSKTGTVYLDLHDKAHGPHGLVAGTTGSGKSEILQTYILAMSTLFAPTEVGFVIIDFKGGGMVNQFKELPHLMGAITNIDGKEINRSLKSIKAELQKRQRYFAEADVNHIDKYIRKFKAGEVAEPLPHLIIIVDEFAELKAEQPEFMKELISAARIGRSLGVHLILATQKPSGQVNEQIWSNSRFKLCLKVQSQEDSNEVIKSPLAAEIKEPGRAYLQVGNNEIFELFQSAYSGAPEKMDDSNVKEFTLYSLTESGKRQVVFSQKKKKSGEGSATQLDAIVRYVADYCSENRIPKLPDICLPSLRHCIDYVPKAAGSGYEVELGIYDDPENQYQGVYTVDLSTNNLMIIGAALSGKTNMLQTIIRSLSTKFTPQEVNIYAIDFASMILKNFEKLNHVGGVVTPSDDEKLKNLFKLIHSEIESRKERLMSVGVSSFAAYKEAGYTDMPLMVLLIDNLTALKELYFQEDDLLLPLCREGLTVGLSVVIANAQTAGIGYKYLSNFSARVAMFCNDNNEYNSLLSRCALRIDPIPGRCIVELEKRHLECQGYLPFVGQKEIERVEQIRAYIAYTNDRNRGLVARRIPLIPANLTANYIAEEFGSFMQKDFSVVMGLDYATVDPLVLNFASLGLLAIAGREDGVKYGWLRYAMQMLHRVYPERTQVHVIDSISKNLQSLKDGPNTVSYSLIAEDAAACVVEIERQLKARYDGLVAGDEQQLADAPLLVLVLDNADAISAICDNREALAAYKNITGRYKNMKVCILTFVENVSIPYSAPEILKNIRDSRQFLFFEDMSGMKLFDPPLAMIRSFKKPIEAGDGYYIKESSCIKLKTPTAGPR